MRTIGTFENRLAYRWIEHVLVDVFHENVMDIFRWMRFRITGQYGDIMTGGRQFIDQHSKPVGKLNEKETDTLQIETLSKIRHRK